MSLCARCYLYYIQYTYITTDRRGSQLENKALKKAPNLGEIKLRVKIP